MAPAALAASLTSPTSNSLAVGVVDTSAVEVKVVTGSPVRPASLLLPVTTANPLALSLALPLAPSPTATLQPTATAEAGVRAQAAVVPAGGPPFLGRGHGAGEGASAGAGRLGGVQGTAPSALSLLGSRRGGLDGSTGATAGGVFTPTRVSVDYNRLESAFLIISALVLMAGMVFESRGFAPGTPGYVILTALTATLIIASSATFVVLLVFEGYRSVRFSFLRKDARRAEVESIEAAMLMQRRARKQLRRDGSFRTQAVPVPLPAPLS